MAWAIAQLGWVAGPAVMVLFAFVNLYTSNLLAQCYRSGDPVTGQRNYTYMDAVKSYLGKNILPIIFSWLNCHYNHEHDGENISVSAAGGRKVMLCGLIQYLNLFGVAIGYTIAASVSMM